MLYIGQGNREKYLVAWSIDEMTFAIEVDVDVDVDVDVMAGHFYRGKR